MKLLLFLLIVLESYNIAGSSNGRTVDSESINLGSNPGPAAAVILSAEEMCHIVKKLIEEYYKTSHEK